MDKNIFFIEKELMEVTEGERNTMVEIQVFLDVLRKSASIYKKADYVRKRSIIELFVSNISLDKEKRLTLEVKPDLEHLFFSSFGDAPGGFSEELKEFTWALGAEYMYDNSFAIRAGYFNESDLKGARKYFTIGSGFKFKSSKLDISYLFNASDINNPLENTLRFSLAFDFGQLFEIN
jgi:hypothetical protein